MKTFVSMVVISAFQLTGLVMAQERPLPAAAAPAPPRPAGLGGGVTTRGLGSGGVGGGGGSGGSGGGVISRNQVVLGDLPLLGGLPQPPNPEVPFLVGGEPGPGRSLIIHNSEADVSTDAAIQEDLAVMSRILEKTIKSGTQVGQRQVLGIDVFVGPNSGSRSVYLEGYGAIFLFQFGYPLLPTQPKADPTKSQPEPDSSWEEARQELYSERGVMGRVVSQPAEDYKEERVTAAKRAVLEALKNSTHIRNLKIEESITVCLVSGAPGASQFRAQTYVRRGPAAETVVHDTAGPQPPEQGSMMTIKVAKADINAFAKGEIKLEEIEKRARIATYAIPAGSGTRRGEGYGGFGGGTGGWSGQPGAVPRF